MSLLTVPNVFTNGTSPVNLIDAVQMNANFTAVATAVNNIYPSQVLPITSGQATFGATATGVGYKFLANDATATPLTVSGVSGQTADIFDVTLTSGGTKAFAVGSAGLLTSNFGMVFTNNNLFTVGQVGIGADGGATQGLILNVPSGSTNGYSFAVSGVPRMQLTAGGNLLIAPTINSSFALGSVPPVYTGTGTSRGSTTHIVFDQVVASSGTTTITLAGPAVFNGASTYVVTVFDLSASGFVTPVIASGSSFSFTSTNTHDYQYMAVGY